MTNLNNKGQGMKNTNHLLTKPMGVSLHAARHIFRNENLVKILIQEEIKELSRVRNKFPTLKREDAILIALLNSAVAVHENRYSEKYSLAKVQKAKATPQTDWLKLHRSFVLKLYEHGASYREIERAILYRFHHKVSHTQIVAFLKMEGANNDF